MRDVGSTGREVEADDGERRLRVRMTERTVVDEDGFHIVDVVRRAARDVVHRCEGRGRHSIVAIGPTLIDPLEQEVLLVDGERCLIERRHLQRAVGGVQVGAHGLEERHARC